MKTILKPFLAFLFFVSMIGCQQKTEAQQEQNQTQAATDTVQAEENPKPQAELLKIDTVATSTAQYIAGLPSLAFASIQQKDFYKLHVQTVDTAWAKSKNEDVTPITDWANKEGINTNTDTMTVFYPFSGPDILYATTFFPNAQNYVMIGLERTGSMPNFGKIPDKLLGQYLEGIRHSLKYINKVGYFVTMHMASDFSKQNLDGNLHIMMYYLARQGYLINSFSKIAVDANGKLLTEFDEKDKGLIKGIRFEFCDQARLRKRAVHYFPLDLSDQNMKAKPQFLKFVDSFGKKATYLKSASYILHNPTFAVLRDYILQNSTKILQDDTGVPYRNLVKSNFNVTLYGDYTRTIKQFKGLFQPDMKKALDSMATKKPLPFTIGYNAWHDQTILIYATPK